MLLISGDVFHTPSPCAQTVDFVRAELARLGEIPVFIALGNHDYAIREENFTGNVHIFPNHFEKIQLGDTVITGISFDCENASFASLIPPVTDKTKQNILLMHGDISNTGTYNPINKQILISLGYDYIALGHIHQFTQYQNIFYPGCHDGSGFDEKGAKGFISAVLENHRLAWNFHESSSLVYETIDFDISSTTSSIEIANEISKKISRGIYRINLIGTTKSFIPSVEFIENKLSENCFFVSVKDSTLPFIDISESSIYRFFSERITASCEPDVASLALKYGVSALKGVLEDL